MIYDGASLSARMDHDPTASVAARAAAETLLDAALAGVLLYAEAEAGVSVVPWADGLPDPQLVEWADRAGSAGSDGAGRRALVVGCGLGYDAEFLAGRGFAVTAFDLAPTAIAGAKRVYPDSPVTYLTADLLDPPAAWAGAFDLVVEAYTVQPLYGAVRSAALAALHGPVAPGGSLLVIARATEEDDPVRDPALMPWPRPHFPAARR